jgi:DNA polymerase-3 subunit alpha
LARKWEERHPDVSKDCNPWNLKSISRIKNEFDKDEGVTKRAYPELFYYFDGLLDTKISQSVHPAGMVISPITLNDNYGTFDKDGDTCLMLDMENIHDFTGLAKYDFLILKTVQVIRDTCNYLNQPYPKTHEINWDDQDVWRDMIRNPSGIFQFEGKFAFDSLKKFEPHSIFDMSLVTACIRPTGASYRDDLLDHKQHKNPSELIDDLLKNNLGYLV